MAVMLPMIILCGAKEKTIQNANKNENIACYPISHNNTFNYIEITSVSQEIILGNVGEAQKITRIETGNKKQEVRNNNRNEGASGEIILDEFTIICRVVEAETHGADQESKIHIAHVILNRVNNGNFPSSISGVCYQSGQFASRNDVEQSTIDAVNIAMGIGDTTNGALFFCTCRGCWADTNKEFLFTDNAGHNFYR